MHFTKLISALDSNSEPIWVLELWFANTEDGSSECQTVLHTWPNAEASLATHVRHVVGKCIKEMEDKG